MNGPAETLGSDASFRRARRALRIVTALALLTLTTLTHWPALGIGTATDPGPDKTIHMLAFALVTAGVWFSGWIRSPWLLWIAGVLWAALDETTQSIPGLQRRMDWEDFVCDALGVTIALAWIAATAPLGGWHSRRRRAARDAAMADTFQHAWAWTIPALAAIVGALLALLIFTPIAARSWAMPRLQVTINGMLVLGLAAAIASVEILVRVRRPSPWPALPDRVHARLAAGPVLAGITLLVVLTALSQLVLVLRPRSTTAALLEEWYRRRPQTFRTALDLGLMLLIAAWACRWTRRRVARRIDRAHAACIRCDQDLRGTPVLGSTGRCPECGALYEVPPAGETGASGAVALGGAAGGVAPGAAGAAGGGAAP